MEEAMLTKDIIRLAKSLKRSMVEITPHYICGSDLNMASFSIIYLDGSVEVSDELYYLGVANELTKYDIYLENMHLYEQYKAKMDYLRQTCQMIENNKCILSAEGINTTCDHIIPQFNDSLNMKAKEGSMMVNVDLTKLFMSSCGTMHPVNKSDVVDIEAYEYDESSFMAKFTINKKKYKIYEYARFLYIA